MFGEVVVNGSSRFSYEDSRMSTKGARDSENDGPELELELNEAGRASATPGSVDDLLGILDEFDRLRQVIEKEMLKVEIATAFQSPSRNSVFHGQLNDQGTASQTFKQGGSIRATIIIMGWKRFEVEIESPVSASRLFKAAVVDSHNLVPKLVPQIITGIKMIRDETTGRLFKRTEFSECEKLYIFN
ncbi:hypothetical protein Syun_007994 [Stephania yunnanensis]|uniref:Bet v I/Major latex protein domain-containing protein n=1 Tax=Stephania yunnanensis TaxID=152371 RepID=A0AAP0KZI6_9MAGN